RTGPPTIRRPGRPRRRSRAACRSSSGRTSWPRRPSGGSRSCGGPVAGLRVEFAAARSRLNTWAGRMRGVGRPAVGVRSLPRPMPAVSVLPTLAPAPNDAALLERFAAGDRSALDELFRRYRGVAYRVAYRLLGREADALDAVQDAFVKALTHLARFRGHSSFKTWLLRIVSNAALDVGRQRQRDGWNDRPAGPPPD